MWTRILMASSERCNTTSLRMRIFWRPLLRISPRYDVFTSRSGHLLITYCVLCCYLCYLLCIFKELLDLGVTKFAVLGIPPIGCVPKVRTSFGGKSRDCGADHNKLAQLYNSKLSRELQRLTSSNNGTKLIYVNIYDTLLDLMQNPEKNGTSHFARICISSVKHGRYIIIECWNICRFWGIDEGMLR